MRREKMNNTRCVCCAAHGIETPATTVVDSVARVMVGFCWSEEEALAAGWTHGDLLCEDCIAQLPVGE